MDQKPPDLLRSQIRFITRGVAIGRFASPERAVPLRELGITHILNVSETANVVHTEEYGFAEVVWVPLQDHLRMTGEHALECVVTLHRMLLMPDSRVYVHCIAGQYRSATVVWLYLIACGMTPQQAAQLIVARSPDAVPGNRGLVNESHVELVREHGRIHFLPHSRAEMIQPMDLST